MRPTISPAVTVRSSPSSASTPPKRFTKPRASSSAVMAASPGIPAHRTRQQALGPEQQNANHQQSIEQEAIFLDRLQFLRNDYNDECGDDEPPGIADAAEQQDRNEDEGIGEGVVVRRDEASDHAKHGAGNTDEKIADQECRDLPAHDIEAETARGGLIEPQRIEIESNPGSFEPPHDNERTDQQQQADGEIIDVERERDSTNLDIVCLLYTSPSPRDGLLS